MTGIPAAQPDSWENEGQRLAPLLDQVFAAVVAGVDANAAAAVAIGIARAQGVRRRVAIADLVGECPPLEALNRSDDPHGIADSFLYGVSLNRIARQVNDAGSVFVMPSGTEAVAHETVYANERWRRLATGFHQVGALLLVVAVPGTPGFAELCGYVGALLPVGETRFPMPAGVPLIAPPPPPTPPPEAPRPAARERTKRAREAAVETNSGQRMKLVAGVAVLGAIAIGLGSFWPQISARLPAPIAAFFTRTGDDTTVMLVKPTLMDTTRPAESAPLDSAGQPVGNAARDSGAAAVAVAAPPIVNPADSADAAKYAIFYTSANTRAEAIADPRLAGQPALAVTPVLLDGSEWFQVHIGASADQATADSLLARLRASKLVSVKVITSVPLAMQLERNVPIAMMASHLATYEKRGIKAYALQQANGTVILYTGAFQVPDQAIHLADSLRALGIAPVLAYRTGRAF